ncbi:MAG: hypothetical protein IPK79_01325 [Vampirovibrionales bacterium]|nr:hypothetical protein [Vampirovibrionales bacterium]
MSASAVAAYRKRRKALGLVDSSRRNRKEHDAAYRERREKPFVGCDGEGAGVDDLGRQNYLLFRMGERELFRDGARLETEELLDFICDADANAIHVGFAFGYDVTMILRDLSPQQQKRLFEPKLFGPGHSPYVWFGNFDIDYLPRNYLKVRRVKRMIIDGREIRVPVKGSQRTIYETFGFFQKSFLKVIGEFDVGSIAERELIAANKARRGDFVEMTEEERRYCALECRMLAELMEKLRDYCEAADIRPQSWSGAGKLASSMHSKHKTLIRSETDAIVPVGVRDLANLAYYGGRFEITQIGHIKQPVYEYDIRSAYPAAMLKLPCLEHGRWIETDGATLTKLGDGEIYVAAVQFKSDNLKADQWCKLGGFPVRSKPGHLYWPLEGGGVYWSPEIESARRMGFKVKCKAGWRFQKVCDCVPFAWVNEAYEYRRSIGSSGPGYPMKLGINSLYGKLAQRKGNGRYHNMIWAGLITAYTRALLNDGVMKAPEQIVMLATDALYSLTPLDLPIGERLGEWEHEELEDLFIVQPGLYWSASKRKKKSRGLSGKFFEDVNADGVSRTEEFENEWLRYRDRSFAASGNGALFEPDTFPSHVVPVPGFIGLRLALARNRPELAGTWVNETREISFDYRNKRARHEWVHDKIRTSPKLGGRNVLSLPHREFLAAGGAEPWERSRLMLEEQPDYVDLSAPYQD